jgi:phage baseplate assembly protein W
MESVVVNKDFLGRGWSFPPTFDQNIKTVEMAENVEDIRQSLTILLSTIVGERVMNVSYGCNLEPYVFESMDTTTITILKDKIITSILFFESRIEVEDINMDTGNQLEGFLLIEITYRIKSTNARYNFVYPFYSTEATEVLALITNHPL